MRKFLNAGKLYRCDTLIMGGDITGKMIVPIVDRGQGVHTATLYGRSLEVTGDDPIFVDDILRSSATVINPEEGQVDLGDG